MTARRQRATTAASTPVGGAVAGLVLAMLLVGCVVPGTESTTDATLDVDRDGREEGDVEGQPGDTLEVFGVSVTVLDVGRVAAYNDLDTSGYVWADVRIENTSSRNVEFHRRHLRLEKPATARCRTRPTSPPSRRSRAARAPAATS